MERGSRRARNYSREWVTFNQNYGEPARRLEQLVLVRRPAQVALEVGPPPRRRDLPVGSRRLGEPEERARSPPPRKIVATAAPITTRITTPRIHITAPPARRLPRAASVRSRLSDPCAPMPQTAGRRAYVRAKSVLGYVFAERQALPEYEQEGAISAITPPRGGASAW
jgi:hypothetical protein